MKESQRITDAYRGELESTLLSAMRDDAPSEGARKRTLAALGCAGVALSVATSTSSVGAATKISSWLAVGKWVGIGVVTGVSTMGVVHEVPKLLERTQPQVTHVARVQNQPRKSLPKVAPAAPATAPPSIDEPQTISPAELELEEHDTAALSTRNTTSKQPALDSQLSDEIASLDVVRSTLASDPERALELLAQHRTKFPRGSLAPETSVLRVKALAASGQLEQAQKLGRQFLSAHPASPHAEVVRNIVAREIPR
jgi:hypothetical protein